MTDTTLPPGTILGTTIFEASAIVAFAEQFDPQPFHLSEAAGRASLFGGLAASGWQTASAWMRLLRDRTGAAEQLTGFSDLAWLKPVLAGDVITYASEIVAETAEADRPGERRITLHNRAVNQRGELVFRFISRSRVAG